jgi:hypothetical protein
MKNHRLIANSKRDHYLEFKVSELVVECCRNSKVNYLHFLASHSTVAATDILMDCQAQAQAMRITEPWLVKCTGNPWVFLAIPIPIPSKTYTHATGTGFFMGQFFCTLTQPIPVPVADNPRVCREIVMPF